MEPILHSFAYSLAYLREMIDDVPDELMNAQPDGVANHPAWTIGHLVFIAQEIGTVVGLKPWLDEDWAKCFGPGSNPSTMSAATSAEGRSPKYALLTALDMSQTKLTAIIRDLTDADLDSPFPDATYAGVFPSIRHALTQVLLGHTAFHIGQLCVWRRAMNLPSIGRSYE